MSGSCRRYMCDINLLVSFPDFRNQVFKQLGRYARVDYACIYISKIYLFQLNSKPLDISLMFKLNVNLVS